MLPDALPSCVRPVDSARPKTNHPTPDELWSALAHLIAGPLRVRISRDGGRNYPLRAERPLTATRPNQPAAVLIHDLDGTCRTLCLDFDSSRGGVEAVASDVLAVTSWLRTHGAEWIEDCSPNGGRHIYVPLNTRVPFHLSKDVVEALSTDLPTLDCTPHQNLRGGCIRVPGSTHKSGGYQRLVTEFGAALSTATRRNAAAVWDALVADLSPRIAGVRAHRATLAAPAAAPVSEPSLAGRMSRTMLAIAAQGTYDASQYSSPSEARQAVLVSAAAAGLQLTDIQRRMSQGIWPGLTQFYARYTPNHRTTTLRREWSKALKHVAQTPGERGVRKTHTSQPTSQGGGSTGPETNSAAEHRFIRSWRTALRLVERDRYGSDRGGLARRMLLRALGAAAHMTGNRVLEFGVRSLSIASGVEPTTVAAHLRVLCEEPNPLIVRSGRARGVYADQYTLVLPVDMAEAAELITWEKGKVQALRPAFRELGMPAAFVFEALEHAPTALGIAELVRRTGLGRTTVNEALEVLAAWGLTVRFAGGWRAVSGASLGLLAELFGTAEDVARLVDRFRAERTLWRAWLSSRTLTAAELPAPGDDYPWEEFEGPPDDWTLSHMMLGAVA